MKLSQSIQASTSFDMCEEPQNGMLKSQTEFGIFATPCGDAMNKLNPQLCKGIKSIADMHVFVVCK